MTLKDLLEKLYLRSISLCGGYYEPNTEQEREDGGLMLASYACITELDKREQLLVKSNSSLNMEVSMLAERIKKLESKNVGLSDLTGLMQSSLEGDTQRISELLDERDELAAQNQQFRLALDKLARLGNEPYLGNSLGNKIAAEALSISDLASPVLNRVKAEALREAAKWFNDHVDNRIDTWQAEELRRMADAIEKGEKG